jgi:hypothetical protein
VKRPLCSPLADSCLGAIKHLRGGRSKDLPLPFGTPTGDVMESTDPIAQEGVCDAGVSKGFLLGGSKS